MLSFCSVTHQLHLKKTGKKFKKIKKNPVSSPTTKAMPHYSVSKPFCLNGRLVIHYWMFSVDVKLTILAKMNTAQLNWQLTHSDEV